MEEIAKDELPKEVQRMVINRTIAEWRVAMYQAEVSARVGRKLGDDVSSFVKEMERCQKHVDALTEELKSLG